MEFKLELVLVPVTDVDRAKSFYVEQAGFNLEVDTLVGEDMRVVQVTPPGSACSVGFGVGITAAVAIAGQDIRITMPPYPMCYDGVDAIGPLLDRAFGPDRDGDWWLVPTAANRMPAAANYLRRPGDSEFRAFKLDVLRMSDGVIAEITTFGASLFPAFGLPGTLGSGTP